MIGYTDDMQDEKISVNSSSDVLTAQSGIETDGKVIFVTVGFGFRTETFYSGERESHKSTENSDTTTRTRSFSLGDADDGDYFDVQVCAVCYRIFKSVNVFFFFSFSNRSLSILCTAASFSVP